MLVDWICFLFYFSCISHGISDNEKEARLRDVNGNHNDGMGHKIPWAEVLVAIWMEWDRQRVTAQAPGS
jgi:hypothetical protein